MPTLKVFVNEATNLLGLDLDGNSDPYCVLKIGEGNQFSAIEKTRKIKNTKNPTWKECFTLNVNNPLTESLFLEVWNKETMTKDDSLGYAQVPLHDLQRGVEKQVWVQLEGGATSSGGILSHLGKKKEKQNLGKVFLGLTALDFGIDPSHAQQQFGQQGMHGQQGIQQQGMQGQQGLQQQHGQQPGIMQPGLQQQGMQQQPGIQQQGGMHGQQGQQGMQQPGIQQGGVQQGMQGQPIYGQGVSQPPPTQPAIGGQQQGIQQPGMVQPGMQQPGMQQPGMQSSTHPPGMSGSSSNDPYKQQSRAQDL